VVTIRDLVRHAQQILEQAGIPTSEAALDAELLARDTLGWDRAAWVARQHDDPPLTFQSSYDTLIERRRRREPVAYIRGHQEFYGRSFIVSPEVLIPRPETELLIDEALLLLPALGFSRPVTVVDVGTGSGCIVVTLAREYPRARYIATDISEGALAVARANAERHGVTESIEFVRAPYFAARPGPFHVVVTNPPYIAASDRHSLAPEVAGHEPEVALLGGDDGLREIREIVNQASTLLDDDGSLLMEIGFDQLERVAAVVSDTDHLAVVRTRSDLQGIPRVAVIRRCR
jgi:release factor glutamine methyltransferase